MAIHQGSHLHEVLKYTSKVQVGRVLSRDHGDSDFQLGRINVYYNETTSGRYIPARFSWTST